MVWSPVKTHVKTPQPHTSSITRESVLTHPGDGGRHAWGWGGGVQGYSFLTQWVESTKVIYNQGG